MKLVGVLLIVAMCACGAESVERVEGESLVLGEWHLAFDPRECADASARSSADFRIAPFEDGGLPLAVLVVDGEDVGSAGFWLDETVGRVRYETAYDGDVLDIELSDDGAEASAYVRYTHPTSDLVEDCRSEAEASTVERRRIGTGVIH